MPELTTLCYISEDDKVLFIHKGEKDDPNCGKFLGVGGHFEQGESPEECVLREISEETGIVPEELDGFRYRGIVTFVSDRYGVEYMHVFTACYAGTRNVVPGSCSEGELMWIPLQDIYGLPMWEGDKVMFDCLYKEAVNGFFSLKLEYEGDKLVGCEKHIFT
ncbi:8-oxo-dGTP diphosphatase [Ruminococcaceae bacterium YRB3002]|nr:8-oxo-dGTP diphosphatase [Ruminococcaceae bacterium YRB3002]